MIAQSLPDKRFIRKTQLGPNEYRKNFHQIDRDIMTAITSAEADQVTPLMSKIYLRLVNAPDRYWEREGVLRFEAEWREGKQVKAWVVLCELVGVASATANKALTWMHEQEIIGYFSGKNGVGLRIFLNRAVSSIGLRQIPAGKKILDFTPVSAANPHASQNEPAFNYAVLENLDLDIYPPAPKNGADKANTGKIPLPLIPQLVKFQSSKENTERASAEVTKSSVNLADEIVQRLKSELEPSLKIAARQAAIQEHERTREWLENHGLPKAARVAQREAYNILRKSGLISDPARSSHSHDSASQSTYSPPVPHSLSDGEIAELAEACIAMLEAKGQPVEDTLTQVSVEKGGFLLPEDAVKVREKTESLLDASRNTAEH